MAAFRRFIHSLCHLFSACLYCMRLLYSTRRGFDSSAMTLSELGVGYPIGLVSLTRILIALPSRRSASPASKSMKLASFATQDATQYYRRCRTRDLGPLQERQRKQVRRPALKNQQGRKRIELCRGSRSTAPLLNVRFGSKADMAGRICDIRFTPKSGHWRA